jgi:hypothetical protein
MVEGNGSITGPRGRQATFSMDVKFEKSKKTTRLVGTFSYRDPASNVSINSSSISSLTFNGRMAHFTGPKVSRSGAVSFTVDATDNGTPGTLDFFSIHLSTGYSASGNLTGGDISIH